MGFNLNLKYKFNLLLGLIFLGGIFLSGVALSKILYQQAEYKLTDKSQVLLQTIEEIKYYTSTHFLDSNRDSNGQWENFRAAIVPAYAAREIFENLQTKEEFTNYKYKEATINPTNPQDTPDTFEKQLINSFLQDEKLKIQFGYVERNSQKLYYISRPLTVNDSSCLQCHSTPDIAPKKMLEIYGDKNGFNWQLNQLTSAQTLYIPTDNIASDVKEGMLMFMPIFIGIFAILIFSMNRLLQYTAIAPINRLTIAANNFSFQNNLDTQQLQLKYLKKLQKRKDESGKLAKAFLNMAAIISDREQNLQREVAARTKELRQEITEREIIEKQLARQVKRALLQEKITQEIRQSLDTSQILQTAVNNVGNVFKVSRCQIFSYCETQPHLAKVVAEYILPEYPRTLGLKINLDEAICLNTAMSEEKAVYWSYVYDTPLLRPCIHLYKQLEINSLLTVRTSYQGKANGAISIQQCDRTRQWHPAEIELMEAVAAQIGIALAQAGLLQQEKERGREIEAAKQEAEIANRSKSEFLANISHELRTPLNAIIGFSQLMNRDPDTLPQQQETINIINRSGEHLLEMINEVLEMSKIEAGKTELHITKIDLKQLLDTLVSMLGIKAKTKNLQLAIACSADVPDYICTDESKLRQVLINLIGNGIKFTQQGSVTLQVTRQSTPETRLQFAVTDTGAGIAAADLEQIFQAFNQSETGRQSQQGTGLGLPISQKFVELMGGELTVSSEVGRGSVFSFDILSHPSERSHTRLLPPKSVKSLAPQQPPVRILIVDDVWQSRLLALKLLNQIGFEVKEAENGKQALEVTQQWQPHLILMDMRMPVMDGYEATKQIRAMEKSQQNLVKPVKILALTASAFESKRAETIEAGCNDYLRKPFKENELFAKIQSCLGVQYIYRDETEDAPQKNSSVTTEQKISLTPASLQIMSDVWRQELKQAATELDETKLEALIAQIPRDRADLAQSLIYLVENFEYETILAVL